MANREVLIGEIKVLMLKMYSSKSSLAFAYFGKSKCYSFKGAGCEIWCEKMRVAPEECWHEKGNF